jgi:hypothetical protein
MGPLPNGYNIDDCPVYHDPITDTAMFSLGGALGTRWSTSLDAVTFVRGNICVGLSKGRQGLPLSISRCCDSLVHIPHLPLCGDTPLLDIPSSLSIMLSNLCESMGFTERAFHEHKFYVTRPDQKAKVVDESNKKRQRHIHNVEEIIEEDEAIGLAIPYDDCGDY